MRSSLSQTCVRYGAGILGTGMDVVPNLPKCPVPVSTSYRTYRSARYRYWRCTELSEVSGAGNAGGIYRWYASARTVPNTLLQHLIRDVTSKMFRSRATQPSFLCASPKINHCTREVLRDGQHRVYLPLWTKSGIFIFSVFATPPGRRHLIGQRQPPPDDDHISAG